MIGAKLIMVSSDICIGRVLYGDLTGVFLVVGCTLFISLVNCLSEISCLDSLIDNFFYLIPCLHQFRGHSWFPIQQIIVKFILPGSTRFGALP